MKRRSMSVREWLSTNRDIWWDLLRVYLGFALVIKGFVYMFHRPMLMQLMTDAHVPFGGSALAEIVALTHIAGGLMLAFGLFTRLGAAIQIPNLLGAVAFVHLRDGLFTSNQTLEFEMLVLFALTLYAFGGAGRLSVDYAFRNVGEQIDAYHARVSNPPAPAPVSHGEGEPAHV